MKIAMLTLVIIPLLFHPSPAGDRESALQISPEKPSIGDEIMVRYSPTLPAGNDAGVMLELMIVRDPGLPVAVEQAMTPSGTDWTTTFTLEDQSALLLLVRFSSGGEVDDRNGTSWETLVYDGDGRAVKSAHLFDAYSLSGPDYYGFSRKGDINLARAEAEKELALFPDNDAARRFIWDVKLSAIDSDETLEPVKRDLEEAYSAGKDDEETVSALLPLFEKTAQEERADSIRNDIIVKYPHGLIAEQTRRKAVFDEADRPTRAAMYEQFMKDFPKEGDALEDSKTMFVRLLISAKQYDRASVLIRTLRHPSGALYNALAWGIISGGGDIQDGTELAKMGMDTYGDPDVPLKPSYRTTRDWEQEQRYGLGAMADTYGYGLEKLGRPAEAESEYEVAYEKLEGEDPDVNERLVACYVTNTHYDKAVEVAKACVEKGSTTDRVLEQYRVAYTALHGSSSGFEQELAAAREVALNKLREEMMAGRINEPAPDFSLKNLDGSTITLSDLKGKVVVVDFWATWCGPCVQSFPFMQQMVDEYIHEPDLVILTLNTWEHKKGEEREALVKKFMEDNRYTFTVLFDETVVNAYKVEGIPTKFLIDRNGMIQFRSIGFMGGQQMIDEMRLQIQMLLSKDFYSMKE